MSCASGVLLRCSRLVCGGVGVGCASGVLLGVFILRLYLVEMLVKLTEHPDLQVGAGRMCGACTSFACMAAA